MVPPQPAASTSHAYNLTSEDIQLNSWTNLYYTTDLRHELRIMPITSNLGIAAGQPPFTKQHYCSQWAVPKGAKVYTLSSHTHKRGKNFSISRIDGTELYSSAIYSDRDELNLRTICMVSSGVE